MIAKQLQLIQPKVRLMAYDHVLYHEPVLDPHLIQKTFGPSFQTVIQSWATDSNFDLLELICLLLK